MVFLSKSTSFPWIDKIRPISVLCIIGKLFEQIIRREWKFWMHNASIISSEQAGFQPK
jgi:hypothetical protein